MTAPDISMAAITMFEDARIQGAVLLYAYDLPRLRIAEELETAGLVTLAGGAIISVSPIQKAME